MYLMVAPRQHGGSSSSSSRPQPTPMKAPAPVAASHLSAAPPFEWTLQVSPYDAIPLRTQYANHFLNHLPGPSECTSGTSGRNLPCEVSSELELCVDLYFGQNPGVEHLITAVLQLTPIATPQVRAASSSVCLRSTHNHNRHTHIVARRRLLWPISSARLFERARVWVWRHSHRGL
jgi:hypothetical protein